MQTEIIKALIGSAGGSDKLYVDDVFSTYIYNADQGNYINVNNVFEFNTKT